MVVSLFEDSCLRGLSLLLKLNQGGRWDYDVLRWMVPLIPIAPQNDPPQTEGRSLWDLCGSVLPGSLEDVGVRGDAVGSQFKGMELPRFDESHIFFRV